MKRTRKFDRSAPAVTPSRLRFAVIGLGQISEASMLPAFALVPGAELVALVSGNVRKRVRLAKKFGARIAVGYTDFPALVRSGAIDAVYIAVPNELHAAYCLQALEARLHVLCEKPLATTVSDARAVVRRAQRRNVCLMTAYRLRFAPAMIRAKEWVRAGEIGTPCYFTATLSYQLRRSKNVRLHRDGGGPVADIGVYCINAARHFFGVEPQEVSAFEERRPGARFKEVPEAVGVLLRFPGGRLATFTVSFGAASSSEFRLVGTKGVLHMDPGFSYREGLRARIATPQAQRDVRFPHADQFVSLIDGFTAVVRSRRGWGYFGSEGLADAYVIDAIAESIRRGRPATIPGN